MRFGPPSYSEDGRKGVLTNVDVDANVIRVEHGWDVKAGEGSQSAELAETQPGVGRGFESLRPCSPFAA
jgi:hypothetical protein